jgi:hypothetical protein
MSQLEEKRMKELLQSVRPPVTDLELRDDLWPRMLRELDWRHSRIPGLDWTLFAALVICVLLFPKAMLGLLYHL